jgi:uncharacterized phiE125 gp8 family phage protein
MTWLPHMVTVAPAEEPVSLDDAKAQCNLSGATYDTLLTSYIKAARAHVEAMCGAKLVEQSLLLRCSDWCDLKHLLVKPIQEITNIKYLDADGTEQTLATSVYRLIDGAHPSIVLKPNQTWPNALAIDDAIRVTVVAGWPDADDVPANIKQAMFLLISTWFESREDQVSDALSAPLANGVKALLFDHASL